ncbi:hypothetical protein AN643_01870 [Candidatus Epulonipiscioides saccharophilum]|nr:hypothetical protein AN643_01870 [Epulopiscium sp. SCG-B10WGA-EpuloB]
MHTSQKVRKTSREYKNLEVIEPGKVQLSIPASGYLGYASKVLYGWVQSASGAERQLKDGIMLQMSYTEKDSTDQYYGYLSTNKWTLDETDSNMICDLSENTKEI